MRRTLIVVALLLVLGGAGASLLYFQAGTGDSRTADDAADSQDSKQDADSNDASTQTVAQVDDQSTDKKADDKEEKETAVPVNVTEVSVGSVSTYITATANLVPEDEVTVLSEAEGRVVRLEVEEGDRVQRGQLLATLLQDGEEIAVEKAKVRAANAELAYERAQRMHDEQLIAQEEFDKTVMDHRLAQQELEETEWRLAQTEIRAPFDGRVTWRNVTLGQYIRPGDELFRVTDFQPLISRIYLPEKDVLTLDPGQPVEITLKADESVRFAGRIQRISPVVDTATGTVKVTVEAIDPPGSVRPGGFVIVDIVRETREGTLVLPREAVIRELKSAHVFVVKDEVAQKRAVELGLEEDERLEIVGGLEPGEVIVVAGQGSLKDGSKVKVLERDERMRADSQRVDQKPTRS